MKHEQVRVPVRLGARSYSIRITRQGPDLVAKYLAGIRGSICVVTDRRVRRQVWPAIARQLQEEGCPVPVPLVVPAGESSKSVAVAEQLASQMLRRRYDRTTCVVAVGGGVVTDLAGWVAATFLRGVDWIAVPTSLLGMVDASIGGKVGVNVGGIKNVLGVFHQPRAVLVGTDFLRTLPARERRNGLGEVVKYAMIADRRLFELLDREGAVWMKARPASDMELVARCARIKARFVTADEFDQGVRATLNFGHTLGHALEGDGQNGLGHGEAVGLGMVGACVLAEHLGVAQDSCRTRLVTLLQKLGLPVRAPRGIGVAELRRALRGDKKTRGGTPRFVLTPRIGTASVGHGVPEELIWHEALPVILDSRSGSRP